MEPRGRATLVTISSAAGPSRWIFSGNFSGRSANADTPPRDSRQDQCREPEARTNIAASPDASFGFKAALES